MLDKVKALRLQLPQNIFKLAYWISDREADVLFSNAKGFPLAFESGTAHGFSACVLAAAGAHNVHTFDIVNRIKVWDHADLSPLPERIYCHTSPFAWGIDVLLESFANPRESAIFFIDGDHKRASVINEWNTIKPFLQPGDRILFHDLNMSGPRKFWGRLSGKNSEGFEFEVIETERRIGKVNITKGYNYEKVEL